VGVQPQGIASDGANIWVANNGSNKLEGYTYLTVND
jgi:hypothetical protein